MNLLRSLAILGSTVMVVGCQTEKPAMRVLEAEKASGVDAPHPLTPRQWLPPLRPVYRLTGSASDTTLINPYIMTATDSLLVLVEDDQRIRAFDLAGKPEWSVGQAGGGPGEYRNIRDVKVAADGTLLVLDPDQGRITVLGSSGRLLYSIPLDQVGHAEQFAPVGAGRYAMLTMDPSSDLPVIDSAGRVVEHLPLPWPEYRSLDPLVRQAHLASSPGDPRVVLAFIFADGWASLDSAGGAAYHFVEHTELPALIQSKTRATVSKRLVRNAQSATAVALQDQMLFVLFDGAGSLRRKQVDLYRVSNGEYVGSYRLPETTTTIAVAGRLLFTYSAEPNPTIVAYEQPAAP